MDEQNGRPGLTGNVPNDASSDGQEDLARASEATVAFLTDHRAKKALKDFVVETYQQLEAEKVERFKARVEHERQVNEQGATPFHAPGNLAPLLAEDLNMVETERSIARSITQTKRFLARRIDERADEISRLLAGIGGFSSQLKACFARSLVVFLEEEDAKHPYRERVVFSIQLPAFELKNPLLSRGKGGKGQPRQDEAGRTVVQATWDDAVNALAKIVEASGLKPRYCKNDRKHGRFVMRQDIQSRGTLPDEFFSFTLDYNTEERIQELCRSYDKILGRLNTKIESLTRLVTNGSFLTAGWRMESLKRKLAMLLQERDYFVGTVPDPHQLEEGILLVIEFYSHKDYRIVKDRMQSVMTKFVIHLSRIAAEDAQLDVESEYEAWQRSAAGKHHAPSASEEDPPEYLADESHLRPVRKKVA